MSNIATYEQAKILNRLGYNKYTPSAYFRTKQVGMANKIPFGVILKDTYQAPTVSEALDYVREGKGVICWIQFVNTGDNGKWKGVFTIDRVLFTNTDDSDTHPLASSALLTAVLEYLEKKGG